MFVNEKLKQLDDINGNTYNQPVTFYKELYEALLELNK